MDVTVSARMERLLREASGQRVLVIGDVMLDEYVWGEVQRISPEAPVPVVVVQERTYRPGGAANVVANIAQMGGKPVLCGVLGDDSMASRLIALLEHNGVGNVAGLILSPERPTIVKSRIVAQNQQMIRLDVESNAPISGRLEESILAWIEEHVSLAQACVLSDYAKGVLTPSVCRRAIDLAQSRQLPIIVDPKGIDFGKYAGATVVVPNLREALLGADDSRRTDRSLAEVASTLIEMTGGASLIIKRGADGMSLFQRERDPMHFPARAKSVYDVTGAGDTVVASLALALASGAGMVDAIALANAAAGVVVGKFGTATVHPEEILSEGIRRD